MFKKICERNEERWQALHSSLCRRHLSSVNPCPGALHWDSTCIWALRLDTGEQSRKLGHPYKQCQHRCPTHTWKRGKRTVHLWPLFLSFLISNTSANPIGPNFKIDPYLLFFIEEHLDSFLFSLVQIIPQWPLLSTSYFFFSPPSFLLSFLTSFSIYRKKSENCETKRRQIPRIVLQRLYSIRFTIHTWNFLFLLLINTNMVTFQLFLNWWTWRCSYYLLPSVIICCLFLIKIAYPCFFITCTST